MPCLYGVVIVRNGEVISSLFLTIDFHITGVAGVTVLFSTVNRKP